MPSWTTRDEETTPLLELREMPLRPLPTAIERAPPLNDIRFRGLVDTRLHEAARAQDLTALRALLAAGAAPAALDCAGMTPLHVCVVDRLIEPLKVLLKYPKSADVCDASGWTLLRAALVLGWQDGARAVLDAGASVILTPKWKDSWRISLSYDEIVLQSFRRNSSLNRYPNVTNSQFSQSFCQLPIQIAIKSGDMEMFEAILAVAKSDGVVNSLNGLRETALYTAIIESNLPAIQALLRSGANPHIVYKCKTTALHVAVHDAKILKYIMDNTDVTSTFNDSGLYPVHEAVCKKNLKSIRLLLDRFNDVRVQSKSDGYTPLHFAVLSRNNEAIEIILAQDFGVMSVKDKNGNTPLHLAALENLRDQAALLLKKVDPVSLSTKNKAGETVLKLISTNFYDPSNFFEHVFDYAIFKKTGGISSTMVNYKLLTDGNDMSQIDVLEEFMRCGHSRVLRHPLIESLMYMKWAHFLPLFCAIIFVYAIFLFSFNMLMISLFYYEDIMKNNTIGKGSFLRASATGSETVSAGEWFHGGVYCLLVLLIYSSLFMLLIQESCVIYLKRLRYFGSVESWVKLSGLVLCALAPPLAASAQGPWPRHVACAALLLAWLQAMFLVSRIPNWGCYVLMFGTVAVNLLKILVTSIFLVIGFSFCFMIQYGSAPPFDGPLSSFVKTLVMMSSEFDYDDLFGGAHDEQLKSTRTIVRMMFVIFVIFMAIVLMNFMIGVAVSDLNDLNETSNIRRLEKQVELLSTFHALVYDGFLCNWYTKIFGVKKHLFKMQNLLANHNKWSAMYDKELFSYNDEVCSPTLHKAILNTANKNYQLVEQDGIDNTLNNKVEALYDAIVEKPVVTNVLGEEIEQKETDSITLQKQIKSLTNDLSKMSHEIMDMKRSIGSIEDSNVKNSRLQLEIMTSLKEISSRQIRSVEHIEAI